MNSMADLNNARNRCPRCRYAIVNSSDVQCPECGYPLRFRPVGCWTVDSKPWFYLAAGGVFAIAMLDIFEHLQSFWLSLRVVQTMRPADSGGFAGLVFQPSLWSTWYELTHFACLLVVIAGVVYLTVQSFRVGHAMRSAAELSAAVMWRRLAVLATAMIAAKVFYIAAYSIVIHLRLATL
ncbi:MAG: hypothetical protein JJU33_09630 [Phycisphaerales bacterium]|nr:hypothetical protein [Phycisphaerales bacterium]